MIKKIYVFLCFVSTILVLFNIFTICKKIANNYNTNIDLSVHLTDYDYQKLESMIDNSLVIDRNSDSKLDISYEKELKEFAIKATIDLFDSSINEDNFISKYYLREQYVLFGKDIINNESDYDIKKKYISDIKNNYNIFADYNGIKEVKIFNYADLYVVKVELRKFKYKGNDIDNYYIEYSIINEKTSNKLKISNIVLPENKKIDITIDKYTSNNSYFDVEYSNNFENTIKIEVYEDDKKIDEASGFFINDQTIMTVYDIFDNKKLLENNYTIIDSKNNIYSIYGLISFSLKYNIAIVRLSEKKPSFSNNMYNNIIGVGESIKVLKNDGIITKGMVLGNDNNIIENNIKLEKKDRGTAILNNSNHIIGINTIINDDRKVYAIGNSIYEKILINLGTFDKDFIVEMKKK